MRRTMCIAAALLAVAATTGCSYFKRSIVAYELMLEVTGAAAEQISYTIPSEDGDASETVANPALPWNHVGVPLMKLTGTVRLNVVPKGGPASCRIVVEKKEVARREGQPGAQLSCTATLKGVD